MTASPELRSEQINRWSPTYWGLVMLLPIWRGLSALPMRVHWLLGSALGEALFLFLSGRKKIARKNLRVCFPDQDEVWRNRILHRHFRRVGRAVFGIGMGAWASPARVEKAMELHGFESIDSMLRSGRPVILLAPHFVDVMFLAQALSHRLPMVTMYKRPRSDIFHRVYRRVNTGESTGDSLLDWLTGNRRQRALQLVEHRQSSLHIAVREMRKGSAFLYLPDQDLGRRQIVFAPFFGVTATSSTALLRFAELGNAAIVPVIACHRQYGGKYDIWFQKPVQDLTGSDDVRDVTRINTILEDTILLHPEYYFWLHKRFKTRPEGEAPFYD